MPSPELKFHERLVALRKERGLTQQALAELVDMHISQIRRYESGQSQPSLEAIRKLAMPLRVSADIRAIQKRPPEKTCQGPRRSKRTASHLV